MSTDLHTNSSATFCSWASTFLGSIISSITCDFRCVCEQSHLSHHGFKSLESQLHRQKFSCLSEAETLCAKFIDGTWVGMISTNWYDWQYSVYVYTVTSQSVYRNTACDSACVCVCVEYFTSRRKLNYKIVTSFYSILHGKSQQSNYSHNY